jgi:hypothetical protein
MECGRKFKTVKAAERAANHGCPKCGGTDVNLDTDIKATAYAEDRQLLRALENPRFVPPDVGR